MDLALAILLIASSVALIVFVLFQTGGKSSKLSQAIAGGSSENFSGKNKQRAKDKKYSLITTYVAIAFAVIILVCAMFTNYRYNRAAADTTAPAVTTEAGTGEPATTTVVTDAATTVVTDAVTTVVTDAATAAGN